MARCYSSGGSGLWTTNGTAAGTSELAGTAGLDPSDLTVFNGTVLFNGVSGGLHGLWATNGAAGGTHELTGGGVTTGFGLNPSDLTVFGSEVLFSGGDNGGKVGLWAWNGTSVTELVAGTAASGLNPSDLTVFGD